MSKVNSSYFGKEFGNLSKDDKIAYKNKVDSVKARLITGRVILAVSPGIAAVIVGIALAILFIPALVPALAFVGTAGAIGILASGVVVLVGGLALGLLMFALSKKTENEATKILQDGQPPAAQEDESAIATKPEAVKPDYINDEDWNKCPDELKKLIVDNLSRITSPTDSFKEALKNLINLHDARAKADPLQSFDGTFLNKTVKKLYKKLNDNEKAVFNTISKNQFIFEQQV